MKYYINRRKKMTNYTIYMHKNKINGKVYIGQTKQTLNERFRKNGTGYKKCVYFYRAIKKYGWENFEHIVLEENINSLEKANEREKFWIAFYNATNKEKGYNCTTGGGIGSTWSEEAKKAQSERLKGENGGFYGKHHTEEYKENMRQQMKQKWCDNEYRKKVCLNMKANHANVKGGNNPQAKKVKRLDENIIYSCAGEAALSIGKDYKQGGKNIARCCRGERNTAYGYKWIFVQNEKGEK